MMRANLVEVLNYYRRLFREARERGDLETARTLGIVTARILMDLEEIPGVEMDTEEQSRDQLLGYVRSRQLELDHIETLLRDDRAEGVRRLLDWIERITRHDLPAADSARAVSA